MSVADYEAIVQRLDGLEPAQLSMLEGEIRTRLASRKQYRLEEFLVPSGQPQGTGEDWVGALRAEWDDRG